MDGLTIVMDNGTATCRAGFANEDRPRAEIETVIGRPRKFPNVMPQIKEYYAGKDAMRIRGVLMMKLPIKDGTIVDWKNMEALWHHLFHDQLETSPGDSSVLMTLPQSNWNKPDIQKTAEIMFETFGVAKLHIENQAVLSLFNSGKTTGIVVDSGQGSTNITPIQDGVAISDKSRQFNVNGLDLNLFLKTMLQQRGYGFDETHRDMAIFADMKESLCYATLNFETEMNPASESSNLGKSYKLPDGSVITVETERFRLAEAMFKPSFLGHEGEGIHKHLLDSIMACDSSIRKELFQNIVLAGGNTLFQGMEERLRLELKLIAPPGTEISSDAPSDRKYSSWIGGSILASLPSFQEMWISKFSYEEFGSTVCHRDKQGL